MPEVKKIVVGAGEISSEIDLVSQIVASESAKDKIKQAVGEYLVEQTLLFVGDAKSPIAGEGWKRSLNPEYKKEKVADGGTGFANLEASGSMLQSFEFETTSDGIKIGIFGSEAEKADGHNNFSGDSELPQRRFLPDEGQLYKAAIERGVDEIINEILSEDADLSKEDLEVVETTEELYSILSSSTGISSRADIRSAVLGNTRLRDMLEELDLLDLL